MNGRVAVSGPLDVARTLARYHLWGEDPANRLTDGVFRRAIRVDGHWRGYEVTWAGNPDDVHLRVTVPGTRSARVLDAAVREVRHICGIDLDVAAFYRVAADDPALADLIARHYGLRPTLSPQPFEMLVGAICAQQVNLAFAFTVRARLIMRYGTPVRVNDETVYAFPEPAVLAGAQVGELRRMHLTVRKAEYIVGLARSVSAGALDLASLGTRSNEDIIERLTAVRGLGRWTAEWFLARGLGRGDVCPAGDLAVRKAFSRFYNGGRTLSDQAIRRRARRWGTHQNLVVHYLLAGLRADATATSGGT